MGGSSEVVVVVGMAGSAAEEGETDVGIPATCVTDTAGEFE